MPPKHAKLKKLKDKIEETRARHASPAAVRIETSPKSSKLKWLLGLTLILLAGAGAYAILHFYVLTRIPLAMVGTWVVTDVKATGEGRSNEALTGGRMYFHRDGTVVVQANMDGKGYTIKATAAVEGDVLRITSVNPNTGQSATDVQTIRTLAKDQLIIEDRKGTVLTMERLPGRCGNSYSRVRGQNGN